MKFPRAQGAASFVERRERGGHRCRACPNFLGSRRADGQEQARDIPSGLALMKTRTLRPAGTGEGRGRWFPEKAAHRSAESRDRAAWCPRRLATSRPEGGIDADACSGYCPRLRGTATGGFPQAPLQSRSEPEGRGRARGAHHLPAGGGRPRTLRLLSPPPPAPPGVRLRSLPRQHAVAGEGWGQRGGGYARGAPLRREAWRPGRRAAAISPARARCGRRGRTTRPGCSHGK